MKILLNKKTKDQLLENSGHLGTLKTKNTIAEEDITPNINEPFLKPENIVKGITICGVTGTYNPTRSISFHAGADGLATHEFTGYNATLTVDNDIHSLYLTTSDADGSNSTGEEFIPAISGTQGNYYITGFVDDDSSVSESIVLNSKNLNNDVKCTLSFNFDYECNGAYTYFYNLPDAPGYFKVTSDGATVSSSDVSYTTSDGETVNAKRIATINTDNSFWTEKEFTISKTTNSEIFEADSSITLERCPAPNLSLIVHGNSLDQTWTFEYTNGIPGSTVTLQLGNSFGAPVNGSPKTLTVDSNGYACLEWLLSDLGSGYTGQYQTSYIISHPGYATFSGNGSGIIR